MLDSWTPVIWTLSLKILATRPKQFTVELQLLVRNFGPSVRSTMPEEQVAPLDLGRLMKKFDISHFGLNAILRGMQLTLVGGRNKHQTNTA